MVRTQPRFARCQPRGNDQSCRKSDHDSARKNARKHSLARLCPEALQFGHVPWKGHVLYVDGWRVDGRYIDKLQAAILTRPFTLSQPPV